MRPRFSALVVALAGTAIALTATAQAALKVTWMPGVSSPGTPARLDRVGIIKVGPSHLPRRQVTLVDRHATYAYSDAIGPYPRNAFFIHLIPFLRTISATAS